MISFKLRRVINLTLGAFCDIRSGIANFERSNSSIAMNAWLPQDRHVVDCSTAPSASSTFHEAGTAALLMPSHE